MAEAESGQIRSLRQTDLRFDDLTILRKGPLQRLIVGGPSEPSDEATVLDLRRSHGYQNQKNKEPVILGER